ncbi:jasmonate-induced protein homolog [Silene latifolia]|uniref:jasmonate-induced protein homolog n=1 Tax=Silene latifolia TaxID=37657 RepID=UPI003D78A75E
MASMQVKNSEQLIANMKNQTPHELHSERYVKYSHPGPGPVPPTIDAGKEVTFDGFVSKGAVIYAGPVINAIGTSPAWVLAWDTTAETLLPPRPNKVYVTCGSKYDIEKMTDEEILKKLDESISPVGVACDPITKATIHTELCHLIPNGNSLKATCGQLIG